MKRILTILLVVMMVFTITSCDPEMRSNMASLMGNMGHNVLGSDTSAAKEFVNSIKVEKAEETKIVVEDGVSKVEITEGFKVNLTTEQAEKAKNKLPAYTEEEKKATVDKLGESIRNGESRDLIIKEMRQEVKGEEVIKGAQGSATVMKAALEQITSDKPEATEKLPPAVKKQLEDISSSLDKIANLEKGESVTNADVVTLRLVESFVVTVNANEDALAKGEVPDKVLDDALDLLTVTSAISEASKFNILDYNLGGLIAGTNNTPATNDGNTNTKALRDIDKVITLDDPIENPAVLQYINLAYTIFNDIAGNSDDFAATKSGLAFHKMSYENYVTMAIARLEKEPGYANSEEFKSFANYEGLLQYAIAAAITEGDDYYHTLVTWLKNEKGVNVSEYAPNIVVLLTELKDVNPWVLDPSNDKYKTAATVSFPAEYADVKTNIEAIGTESKRLIQEEKRFEGMLKTIRDIVEYTDMVELVKKVPSLKDVNFKQSIQDLMDSMYNESSKVEG